MKFLTLAAGIALAIGGIAATAPASAQGRPGWQDNGRHEARGHHRRDDRRWNNHHRRCWTEWRHHRRVRICR